MVDLAAYDLILANLSGGKDSQAMLDVLAESAAAAGVADRIVCAHADMGAAEWPGTGEVAASHARAYGLRFESAARPQGDLLAHIEARGMFPSSSARYCTSDHKRGQINKLITSLVGELRAGGSLGAPPRQARVLSAMGIRAAESRARSGRRVLDTDHCATSGRRLVQTYLPILGYTEAEVWDRIGSCPTEYHYAYDLNLPRVSCVFCVLADKTTLIKAAKQAPRLARRYLELERKTGHTIRADLSMEQIIRAADEPVYEQGSLL